jgi:hypothetical protein
MKKSRGKKGTLMKWKRRLGHDGFSVKRLTSVLTIAAMSVIFKKQNVIKLKGDMRMSQR